MKLRVRFFSAYREAAGIDELTVKRADRVTVRQLFAEILETYPALKKFRKSALFAVNREYAEENQELADGDEVAIMPPVGGG